MKSNFFNKKDYWLNPELSIAILSEYYFSGKFHNSSNGELI
jgi:hypothetical protein